MLRKLRDPGFQDKGRWRRVLFEQLEERACPAQIGCFGGGNNVPNVPSIGSGFTCTWSNTTPPTLTLTGTDPSGNIAGFGLGWSGADILTDIWIGALGHIYYSALSQPTNLTQINDTGYTLPAAGLISRSSASTAMIRFFWPAKWRRSRQGQLTRSFSTGEREMTHSKLRRA